MTDAEFLKRACWKATKFEINRYLMANADGRWDGAEKAQRHGELCDFYLYVFSKGSLEDLNHYDRFDVLTENRRKLHRATQDGLTDRLDEVIGFPIKGRPDYDSLAPAFFEVWHRIAIETLVN